MGGYDPAYGRGVRPRDERGTKPSPVAGERSGRCRRSPLKRKPSPSFTHGPHVTACEGTWFLGECWAPFLLAWPTDCS